MKALKLAIVVLFIPLVAFFAGKATASASVDLPQAFYVHSDNVLLKSLLGVNNDFDGVFSTELSGRELGMLKALGIKTEKVQIRKLAKKPGTVCGNNICEPSENIKKCPKDCSGGTDPTPTPEPTTRSCTPNTQIPWGVNMVNGASGGVGVTVAVLDTGVKQSHLDLVGRIIGCETAVTHFRADTKSCEDAHGHGTHVSGTILADGGADGLGIKGVAPEANLMTIKVCDRRGWCYGDDVAAGINKAVANGANIISMSIGGNNPDPMEQVAIDNAVAQGVLVIAAAGNDGPVDGSIDYPGAFASVVAVGAIDVNKNVPSWSSRGFDNGDLVIDEKEIELGTPGVSVESSYKNGCYKIMSGTSMATPHVAGLAAMLWQGSASATRNYLQSVAQDIWASGYDTATGFGLPIAP